MAQINNTEKYSSILIKKNLHFVFGYIHSTLDTVGKIKASIDAMREYFQAIGLECPPVNFKWKEAKEGEWILSDDYRVLEVLKRTDNQIENAYNKAILRTCVGTFAVNKHSFMDTDFNEHPDRYRVSNNPRHHIDNVKSRETITKKEVLFAKYVAKGYKPNVAYSKVFNSNRDTYVKQMANTLVTQERIQTVVNDEVSKILEDNGVDKQYIVSSYKDLVDKGLLNVEKCGPAVRAALKDLADMSGMSAQKNKSIEKGVLHEISDDVLDKMEEAEVLMETPYQIEEHQEFIVDEPEEEDILTRVGRSLIS